MTVHCPVCEKHRHPWLLQTVLTSLLLFFLLGSILGLGVLASVSKPGDSETILPAAIGAAAIGFLCLLIVTLVVQSRSIQPKIITDESITLVRVSKIFVEELESNEEED